MTRREPVVTGSRTVADQGNSMLLLYRFGDGPIACDTLPTTSGDRILIKSCFHETARGMRLRRDPKYLALMPGGQSRHEILVNSSEMEFLGRIVGTRQ